MKTFCLRRHGVVRNFSKQIAKNISMRVLHTVAIHLAKKLLKWNDIGLRQTSSHQSSGQVAVQIVCEGFAEDNKT